MLKIGDTAPDFTLMNQDNIPISLHDFAGTWVVVYFYPKDDTPGCTLEACSFRDSMDMITDEGISVLGISKDSVMSHKKFHEKYRLNFPILADPEKKVIEEYGVWVEKSMYGRKYMGIERTTFVINPEGKIAHIFPNVTPKGHELQVLNTIKKLHVPN